MFDMLNDIHRGEKIFLSCHINNIIVLLKQLYLFKNLFNFLGYLSVLLDPIKTRLEQISSCIDKDQRFIDSQLDFLQSKLAMIFNV